MQIDKNYIKNELATFFAEKITYDIHQTLEEIITDVSHHLKLLLDVESVAIYTYDSWKDDFELVTNMAYEKSPLRSNITRQTNLVKAVDAIIYSEMDIFDGRVMLTEHCNMVSLLVPLSDTEIPYGYIFIATRRKEKLDSICKELKNIANETYSFLRELGSLSKTKEKANKYELLFRVTRKFHSSIDTNDVLAEIINTLSDVYPQFKCNLFLSQDYNHDSDLPISELVYNDEDFTNKASLQAFLTGAVQFENDPINNNSRLFAPLKGRQGVYGVLHITAPNTLTFPDGDIEFITLLASTAGNALENARLYQQSKQFIADLQLINETSHRLNSNLRLIDTTSFMIKQIRELFGAQEIGFFLFKDEGLELLEGSTLYFAKGKSTPIIEGILPSLEAEKEALFIGDFAAKYPSIPSQFSSVMAIPMIQSQELKGVLLVLHELPYFFSFEAFKLIRSLVHHCTLAFVNSLLREQLEKLVITDYLTKLYSRKYLDEKFQEHLATDKQGVFLLVDIDDFKKVNDTYGHDTGDELLIQVAMILKHSINDGDFAARWGGEELAIYLPNANLEGGLTIARRIIKKSEFRNKSTSYCFDWCFLLVR